MYARLPATYVLALYFAATGPDQRWLSEITYIHTGERFLYRTCMMDAWSMSRAGDAYDNAMMESP